jgi:PAS domain S-box-containing protein
MLVEYQSVGRDITETKRAEKELQLKNAELHAAYEQITATEEELRQNYEELGKSQQDLQAAYEQLTATEEELRQNYEELGKSEQALRKSEERYRNVVEDQTEFICRFTPYGKLTFVNDAYCRYFGLDKETCIGTRHTVVIPSEDLERMTQHLSGFSPQNPFGIIEHRIIMPSGDVRWQHWSDRGIFDENGRVVEYQSVGRDITERKQAEDELRESENLFRSVGDSLLDPVLILSSEGIVQFANRAAIRFIGLPDAAIIHGQSFMTYLDGDSWNRAIGDLHTIHELGGPLTAEYCINPLKGETRWVEASVIRIDYKGSHAALVTLRDITERIRVEEQLRGSERRLADIISFLPDATLVIDKNGAVLAWNRAMEEMTGVPAEQMIGKANYEYALPFYHERRPIMVDLVLHDDPAIVAKYPVIKKEGNSLFSEIFIPHLNKGRGAHLWFTASPLCDTAGNLMGAIESIRDITERKAAEDALFRVNKKLTILSSITRHDIKNQLIALSAYLELSKKELDPLLPASEYLKKEVKIAQTIEHQIDFTKVYEDMGTTAPVWQNIKASVRRATAALPKGNVRVEIDRTDLEIYADSLFEKVFYNLIDNALKYGGETMTTIRISSLETDAGLVIACEDDGTGIPGEDKQHLFEQGYGKHTGLGLFLTREILSITGITIAETSETGKGARFEILVPKASYRAVPGTSE